MTIDLARINFSDKPKALILRINDLYFAYYSESKVNYFLKLFLSKESLDEIKHIWQYSRVAFDKLKPEEKSAIEAMTSFYGECLYEVTDPILAQMLINYENTDS